MSTEEREIIEDVFSTHWIKYIRPAAIYVIVTGAALAVCYITILTTDRSPTAAFIGLLTGSIILIGIHHWFFHRVMSEGMEDAIITNKRFIYFEESLWMKNLMHELTLDKIRAVQAHKKGIMQNLLNYGTLWFDTGGSSLKGGRIIHLMPQPHRKAKIIMNILEMK